MRISRSECWLDFYMMKVKGSQNPDVVEESVNSKSSYRDLQVAEATGDET